MINKVTSMSLNKQRRIAHMRMMAHATRCKTHMF